MDNIFHQWKKLIKKTLIDTISDFCNEEEINKRTEFIASNLDKIKPEALYNFFLFTITNNKISSLAIDYRIALTKSNYEETILNGKSILVDFFRENFEQEYQNLLKTVNIFVTEYIINDSFSDFFEIYKNFSEQNIKKPHKKFFKVNGKFYYMSENQFLYICLFNNLNEFSIDENEKEEIKNNHLLEFLCFYNYKKTNHEGFDLKYFESEKIFS